MALWATIEAVTQQQTADDRDLVHRPVLQSSSSKMHEAVEAGPYGAGTATSAPQRPEFLVATMPR